MHSTGATITSMSQNKFLRITSHKDKSKSPQQLRSGKRNSIGKQFSTNNGPYSTFSQKVGLVMSPTELKSGSAIDEDTLERNEITLSNRDLHKFSNDESSPLRIDATNS